MKVHSHENKHSRRILAAMIHDPTVAARIASKWQPQGLFASRCENMLAGWCVEHVNTYGKPIGRDVLTTFDQWAMGPGRNQEAMIGLIEKLLGHVMDEHGRESADYVIDLAGRLFNEVRMRRVKEVVETHLEAHDPDAAWEEWMKVSRVELGTGALFKPGEDLEGWREIFDMSQVKPLITYPGKLGEFFADELARDSFVVFMASSKRGKSFWLLDLAYRGARQRNRVAYFEAGDLSHRQIKRRMAQRALRRPGRQAGSHDIPTSFPNREEPPKTESRRLEPVTASETHREWRKVQREMDLFRLSCHSNSSLSTQMIASMLQDWAREDWVVDVVVIDYADILAPPKGVEAVRDQINESWKHLRRISQDLHCLVVTATQADAKSYDRNLLGRSNFSEDRRKHDHVTAMIGINVTDDDKKKEVSRLNYIERRGDAFT